jgi:hypothetical protein
VITENIEKEFTENGHNGMVRLATMLLNVSLRQLLSFTSLKATLHLICSYFGRQLL